MELLNSFALRSVTEEISANADGTRFFCFDSNPKSEKKAMLLNVGPTNSLVSSFVFPSLPGLRMAAAGPDFTKFAFLSENKDKLLICLLDEKGVIVATQEVNDYVSSAVMNSKSFSADGKFLAVSYINDISAKTGVLRVYETEKLTEIASHPIMGEMTAPQAFTLQIAAGYFTRASDPVTFWALTSKAPSALAGNKGDLLQIYRFSDNKLIRVADRAICNVGQISVSSNGSRALVSVAQGLLGGGEKKSLYPGNYCQVKSSLSPVDDNLSLFTFDLATAVLTCVYTEHFDTNLVAFHILPGEKTALVLQKAPGASQGNTSWMPVRLEHVSATKVNVVPYTLPYLSTLNKIQVALGEKVAVITHDRINLFKFK